MFGGFLAFGRPEYLGFGGSEGEKRVSDGGEVRDERMIPYDKAKEGLDLSGSGEGEGPSLDGSDFVKHGFDAPLCDAMPEEFHLFLHEFAFG